MPPPATLKALLDSRRSAAREAFLASRDGVGSCITLSAAMDALLCQVFEEFPPNARQDVAVLALGGYGRAELFPHSDVDVMILTRAGSPQGIAAETASAYLHALWDVGLNVGHSVRTVDEALAQHGATIDAWIAMLESRCVCGSAELAATLYGAMNEQFIAPADSWLVSTVLEESAARQARFGSSVKLLEPNIKKSAGGLRDLHTVYWLHRGTDRSFFAPIAPERPATLDFLDRLRNAGILDEDVYASSVEALRFLFGVRTAMHLQREGPHDTLEFALQATVAEALGYPHGTELRSVEVFMRDYYLHARTVHSLYHSLGQHFRESLEPSPKFWNKGRKVGSIFRIRDDTLGLLEPLHKFSDVGQLFETFMLAASNEAAIDIGLRTVLQRSADLVTPEAAASPECMTMLRHVFLSRRVAGTLREMNEVNVLGRVIPEFGELVAFFQHNVYHYYTADEHTLIAMARAEHLRDEQGLLHDVHRKLPRRELLYLAVLLHDITKPRGVADHEITGVAVAMDVAARIGFGDLAHEVGFLVRNHLAMEQVAFRRNVNDPDTLKEFTARFESPGQLDYLYVLTYADLSAVNPNVWTEWKATMLQELYQRTSEVLHRNLKGEQVDRYHEARREEAEDQVVDALKDEVPAGDVRRHLDAIPNASYTVV
ncbi:MAG TPA: HD domain-containing protein, partial [Chloroflexota bacterium]